MNNCYYCNDRESINTKYGKPICNECNGQEIRSISDPRKEKAMTDDLRAMRLKIMLSAFRLAFKEEQEK